MRGIRTYNRLLSFLVDTRRNTYLVLFDTNLNVRVPQVAFKCSERAFHLYNCVIHCHLNACYDGNLFLYHLNHVGLLVAVSDEFSSDATFSSFDVSDYTCGSRPVSYTHLTLPTIY